jgi:hypothetical protein
MTGARNKEFNPIVSESIRNGTSLKWKIIEAVGRGMNLSKSKTDSSKRKVSMSGISHFWWSGL